MTDYNEAIKNLQTIQLQTMQGMLPTIRMAIEALEKQIPKKVKIITTGKMCVLQEMSCPVCHKFFGERIKGDAILFHTPTFCERCGQALDWGDE